MLMSLPFKCFLTPDCYTTRTQAFLVKATLHLSHAAHRTSDHWRVWRRPRNEPLVEVDRAVLVAVHRQAAVLIFATIRSLPQWHVLLMLAGMTHPGRIALVYYRECFPKAQTLVFEYLHKAVEPPIIIRHAIAYLALAPFFGGLNVVYFVGGPKRPSW